MGSYWWNSGFNIKPCFYILWISYQEISSLCGHIIRQVPDTPLLMLFVKIRRQNLFVLEFSEDTYDERRKIEEILSFNRTRSLGRIEYDVFLFRCALYSPGGCFDNNLHGSNI